MASGWTATRDPECLTLTKSGLGALQLSSALKGSGAITESDVREFYEPSVPLGSPFEAVTLGTFCGFRSEYELDGTRWFKFWLYHRNLLIFATYNGTREAWRLEKADVYSILQSLRLRDQRGNQ